MKRKKAEAFISELVLLRGRLDDEAAVLVPDLFPVFPRGVNENGEYVKNQIVLDDVDGRLYRIMLDGVKPLESQPPHGEGMLAVYRPIEVNHDGTPEDPIAWVSGIDCLEGQYFSYEGHIYKVAVGGSMIPCTWAPDSGIWQWEKIS